MYNSARLLSTLALIAPLLSGCKVQDDPWSSAKVIERRDEVVGGPKASARPGDILLENDRIKLAIIGARNNLGPGLYGGSIIDADVQRTDPRFTGGRGRDQLAELTPTTNMYVHHPTNPVGDEPGVDQITIVNDGSDGEAAVVRVDSPVEPFIEMLRALSTLTSAPDQWMVTEYRLEPGKPWVEITTTVHYGYAGAGGDLGIEGQDAGYHQDSMPVIEWAIENGLILGDFYLQGGNIDVFAPGIGFDEDGAVFEAFEQERNLFTDPFVFDFLGGVGEGVSYGIAPAQGKAFIPLFTASQTAVVGAGRGGDLDEDDDGVIDDDRFAAGTALTYKRYFFVGDGDMGSIVDGWVEALEVPYGEVYGNVLEEGTRLPLSNVDVFAYRPGDAKPYTQWTTDVRLDDQAADGSFGGRLPTGNWELLVHQHGRPDSARIPVAVGEGTLSEIVLESPRAGLLSFTVRDDDDMLVPSKVSIYRVDDDVTRNPVLGDSFIGGNPEFVLFPMYGEGEVELPDGEYYAIASRGTEYEIDRSPTFVVDATRRQHLDFLVQRSVVTDGWISADFHVHASPSHDSGVALADRVRTMASEGVEFFASTDHDVITDYAPVIEDLGMENWVQSAVGLETTTIEVGHFLSFPMAAEFLEPSGAPTPRRNEDVRIDWTGLTPDEILTGLDQMGRDAGYNPITFVGHPRAGILGYFDQYGFSPYGGVPGTGGEPGAPLVNTPTLGLTNPLLTATNISWDFEGLEMLNGKRFDYLRTPTLPELTAYGQGEDLDVRDFMTRTMEEQVALQDGTYTLGGGVHGDIDDWFTLLNLGYRYTVLGNSDTHSWTGTESGCPRNYVMSETDDPAFLDDQQVANAVRRHEVVASYGPFVQLWVDDAHIGQEIVPADATVDVAIEVQAPNWMDVDRVELYQNGELIQEWTEVDGSVIDGDVLRFSETLPVELARDSWFVAVTIGDESMNPVMTPVEIPYVELQEIVLEALSGVGAVSALLSPAIPVPRKYDVYPYAITNPVWVDLNGDGFDAPGVPAWMATAPEPPPPQE